MPDYKITPHAMTRMSQRGVRNEDAKEVLTCGTQIGPVEWFMRDKDVKREVENLNREFRQIERTVKGGKQRFERALKRRVQQLERLRGLKVVVDGDTVITSYWPSDAYQRRSRRRGKRDRV